MIIIYVFSENCDLKRKTNNKPIEYSSFIFVSEFFIFSWFHMIFVANQNNVRLCKINIYLTIFLPFVSYSFDL